LAVGRSELMLSSEQAELLCEELKGSSVYKESVKSLCADPGVIAYCFEGPGAIGKCQLLCGPSDPAYCQAHAPTSLRAIWGLSTAKNAFHCSANLAAADAELRALFPAGTLALQRTLCIVKPQLLPKMLEVRMALETAGFTILKEKQTFITESRAKEFLAEEKNKADYKDYSKGQVAILVLCRLEAVAVLQQVIGPSTLAEAPATSLSSRFGPHLHASSSLKRAAWEVRFFFPELGSDPIPGNAEVRDFIFRKTAKESMNLKTLSPTDTAADYSMDPTIQQLISQGLWSLCQVRPKGLQAVSWFKDWLAENNPNTKAPPRETNNAMPTFKPEDRTKRFVETGVTAEGMVFTVEAPAPLIDKPIVEVDVAQGQDQVAPNAFDVPPYVVLTYGGDAPLYEKLCEELKFVYLDLPALLEAEVAAATRLGTEMQHFIHKKEPVPADLTHQVLKQAMLKNKDCNRFLLQCSFKTVEETKAFEAAVATISFILAIPMETPAAGMDEVLPYYTTLGKVRVPAPEEDGTVSYDAIKTFFKCRFLYLICPPALPFSAVAIFLEEKYGYHCVDVRSLLSEFANSDKPDAELVKAALTKGKTVDASLACPLVLAEVEKMRALGVNNFVICDFPQTLKQIEFLEYRIPCISRPLLLDLTKADAEDLASMTESEVQALLKTECFYSEESKAMIAGLPDLQKVPISLAEIETSIEGQGPSTPAGLQALILEALRLKVEAPLKPKATLALGLPGSGSEVLAPLLAKMSPNTYFVDCKMLLEAEIQRGTKVGMAIKKQIETNGKPSLSTTLKLLKEVVGLTCSDSIVLYNAVTSVEDIPAYEEDFDIEKAWAIEGDEKAISTWRGLYLGSSTEDEDMIKAWGQEKKQFGEVLAYFEAKEHLEKLAVSATPNEEELQALIEAAMPEPVPEEPEVPEGEGDEEEEEDE